MKPTVKQASVRDLIDKELKDGRGMEEIIDRMRNCIIVRALEMTEGNKCAAADLLKVNRNTIQRWLDHFGLTEEYRRGPGEE